MAGDTHTSNGACWCGSDHSLLPVRPPMTRQTLEEAREPVRPLAHTYVTGRWGHRTRQERKSLEEAFRAGYLRARGIHEAARTDLVEAVKAYLKVRDGAGIVPAGTGVEIDEYYAAEARLRAYVEGPDAGVEGEAHNG